MLDEKSCLQSLFQFISKGFSGVEVRALSGSSTPDSSNHGPSQKVRSIALSKMSWYAEALRFNVTGRPVASELVETHSVFFLFCN